MNVYARFTGLAAFVRNTNGLSARVVLVDASSATPCDTHEPMILVSLGNWDPSINRRVPRESFFDSDFDDIALVFPLFQEDLVFPSGTIPLGLQPPVAIGACPGADSNSFSWVARIRDLSGDGAMRNNVLTDQAPSGVASRVRISSGHFSTRSFRAIGTAGGGLAILKWRTTFGGTTIVRPLAEEVLWMDSVVSPTGVIEISARAFSGTVNPSFFFRQDPRGRVRFKVVNFPLDKIRNPAGIDPFRRDDCFAEFYRLGSGVGPILEPVLGDSCEHGGGGLSNPRCPCACFDDNPNA